MFPAKRKDALAKKKLQMLQALEPPCDEGAELLAAARACGARRVVVKRPAKGPWLGDAKPSRSLAGKTVRYDVYECVGG
jgi:16S rRNA (guanine1516-N2)-methyltransferase